MPAGETIGDRIRAMRIERGLSQAALAARMPPVERPTRGSRRTHVWVGGIETGKQDASVRDLLAFGQVLQVDARWLIFGDQSGDTEFIGRMRGLEPDLDARARRDLLVLATHQAGDVRARPLRAAEAPAAYGDGEPRELPLAPATERALAEVEAERRRVEERERAAEPARRTPARRPQRRQSGSS